MASYGKLLTKKHKLNVSICKKKLASYILGVTKVPIDDKGYHDKNVDGHHGVLEVNWQRE